MLALPWRTIAGNTALASTLLLAALLVASRLASPVFNPVILVVQLVPLALTVPGQLKGSARAFQWLCFVVLFFMVQGILRLFTPGGLFIGSAETLICLVLFVSAIIFIRASRRTPDPP